MLMRRVPTVIMMTMSILLMAVEVMDVKRTPLILLISWPMSRQQKFLEWLSEADRPAARVGDVTADTDVAHIFPVAKY